MYAGFEAKGRWQYNKLQVGSWAIASSLIESEYGDSSNARVLDVGAFDGQFLGSLNGFSKFAIEPSVSAVSELKSKSVDVVGRSISSIDHHRFAGYFDVVTMFDVFEHLLDPVGDMDALMELLQPGGVLLLSTGNADHWTFRLLRANHWYMHTVQHLCVGSEAFFEWYARDRGYKIDAVVRHSHSIGLNRRVTGLVETLHYWGRCYEYSSVVRMLQTMPGFGYLMHKSDAAFAKSLRDHILVVIRRAA